MRKSLVALFAAVAVSPAAFAVQDARRSIDIDSLEAVESIPALGRIYSWTAIDNDTLIVWARRHDPYLVELMHPSFELRWSQTIGISEFGGRIHAGFDKVYVGGFDYPISRIYKLTRDEARALR